MKTLKPSQVTEVLDLAMKIKQAGGLYVPCFAGDAGIGKSETIQQWAKAQGEDFQFLDIRLAYMEGPDLIGMPSTVVVNGETISIHALPDFLPRGGRGLILFEEPNRAHESTMNALMQVLTDGKIHKWELPIGWGMAAAINPEGRYTVNTMDPAMKNRFAMFNVEYDHLSFVEYIKSAGWNSDLVNFIDKYWVYKNLDQLQENAFYVSPRSLKQVNSLLKVDADKSSLFPELLCASIGKEVAADFIKFQQEHRPVLAAEIIADTKVALAKLKKITDSATYSGDLLSLTVGSVVEAFNEKQMNEALLLKVIDVLTIDQGINLLTGVIRKMTDQESDEFLAKHAKALEATKRRQSGKIAG